MHVALIADGNGRWGIAHHGERSAGHLEGAKALYRLIEQIPSEITHLTFYGLSIDNIKKRPKEEVEWIYTAIKEYYERALEYSKSNGIHLNYIGNNELPADLLYLIQRALFDTQTNKGVVVTIALSYDGHDEITRAVQSLQRNNELATIGSIERSLDTYNLPPVDMLVRVGGEKRLSGFLLWQCAYAELFFSDTLFPDFTVKELEEMLAEYHTRERRFGGLSNKVEKVTK